MSRRVLADRLEVRRRSGSVFAARKALEADTAIAKLLHTRGTGTSSHYSEGSWVDKPLPSRFLLWYLVHLSPWVASATMRTLGGLVAFATLVPASRSRRTEWDRCPESHE